jgi:transposase
MAISNQVRYAKNLGNALLSGIIHAKIAHSIPRRPNKIKHFRRIATRYEKTALSFASMLFLVGAMIWLR